MDVEASSRASSLPTSSVGPSCALRGLSICPSPMSVQSSHLVSARH